MSDIVERLRILAAVDNCQASIEAADTIPRLTAEVERLVKSRNRWGQKYNKLLEKHKVTLDQLKAAVWSDTEECKFLTAENERLRAAMEDIAYPNPVHGEDQFMQIARAALEGKQ